MLSTWNIFLQALDKSVCYVYNAFEVIQMKNENRVDFYMKRDTVKLLDELAKAYGMSRSAWMSMKIQQEYDALQGDEKLQETLITLNEIKRLVQTINVK